MSGTLMPDGGILSETEDGLGMVRHRGTELAYGSNVRQRFVIRPDDLLSARAEAARVHELARGAWRARTESSTRMHADREHFHLEARLVARENGEVVFDRTWSERIHRALV